MKIIDKKYGPVVMQDVLQHLSDSIEHRNKDTLDVKPFILESSPLLKSSFQKHKWSHKNVFGNKCTISYKKTTS